jgi:hypothetical protein
MLKIYLYICINMGEIIDKVKEKAKDVKYAVVDTTKDDKEKITMNSPS